MSLSARVRIFAILKPISLGDKKVIEYIYRKGSITKVKELVTSHKKSIFGITTLDESTLVSSGLDGKIMIHSIEHQNMLKQR